MCYDQLRCPAHCVVEMFACFKVSLRASKFQRRSGRPTVITRELHVQKLHHLVITKRTEQYKLIGEENIHQKFGGGLGPRGPPGYATGSGGILNTIIVV